MSFELDNGELKTSFGLIIDCTRHTMADTIACAIRRRGTVRAHLTRVEKDIGKLEDKEELTPSHRK